MEFNKDIKTNKNIDKFESKIVFNDNDQYRFVFKKQERLVAALYLITNLFADQEPLKWKIREQSLISLTKSLELTSTSVEDRRRIVASCAGAISELIALCQIAHIAKYISDMNHMVLSREFATIVETIEGIAAAGIVPGGSVLSSEFFSVLDTTPAKKTENGPKGHSVLYNQDTEKKPAVGEEVSVKDKSKELRIQKILEMLRLSKTLSIKEFSGVIKDCSEKTIQRELLAMVDEGVLKKTGERRWSVYSLK